MTLPSSEVKYVVISDTVKEIIYFLLSDIGIYVELPIVMKTNYTGAIFLAQNASMGVLTRQADTWYHCIREGIE
jgi:hypothetical protein